MAFEGFYSTQENTIVTRRIINKKKINDSTGFINIPIYHGIILSTNDNAKLSKFLAFGSIM